MHFVLAGRPTKWFLVLCSFFKLKSVELFGFGKEVRKAQVKDAETLHPQLVPWSEKTPVHSNIKGGAGEWGETHLLITTASFTRRFPMQWLICVGISCFRSRSIFSKVSYYFCGNTTGEAYKQALLIRAAVFDFFRRGKI